MLTPFRFSKNAKKVYSDRPTYSNQSSERSKNMAKTIAFTMERKRQKNDPIKEVLNGRILNTDVAGGFVDVVAGLYASSNGQQSNNKAY